MTSYHWLLVSALGILLWLVACQTQPNQVFIQVDGRRQALTTEAETVREALAEANVILGAQDKVSPDLYVALEPGLEIAVIRVTQEIETMREPIPYEQETVVNEALDPGETRLAQLGTHGEREIRVEVTYEDGEEVARREMGQQVVLEPVPEILVIGPQEAAPPVAVEGTIAYLSNSNAWIMRDTNTSRRALTTEGDLDAHVFALSPDGRRLVYTTHLSQEIDLPLNQVWLADTTIVGEQPITLPLQGMLEAHWSPVMTQSLLAYSTAERTASAPGWRANNDLWLLDLSVAEPEPVEVLPANTQGLYPWWGTSFAWSPDGTRIAYARADEIGVIDLSQTDTITDALTPLAEFAPLNTFSEWVWVPKISWSPEGEFLAATVHGPPLAAEPPEESQVFDLWLLGINGTIEAKVADQVGMWSNPAWGPNGIAYGEAENPLQSVNSRYAIYIMDRDGSNRRQLFPFQQEPGVQFPELVWSPEGDDLLFVYNGDLYLTAGQGSPPRRLTTDSQASQPQWVAPVESLISASPTLTTTPTLTPTAQATGTPALESTPTLTVTRTITDD